MVHRTTIGPTPQKDGMVLGLFDGLSPDSHKETPSKRLRLSPVHQGIQATPTKTTPAEAHKSAAIMTGRRQHRSPLSESKQSCLNQYLTPSAQRILKNSTPGSRNGIPKLNFDDTPAFLRRNSQRALVFGGKENADPLSETSWSPVAVRKRPMLAGRGLSALVKGLRDMEDDRLDEDLGALREMGATNDNCSKPQEPKILVQDSQRPDMPLGPDVGLESEDDADDKNEGKGRDGKPLKVWKKKGQKRTTRKITMKPNVGKWKPEPIWKGGEDSGEVEDKILVNDTQNIEELNARSPKLDDEGASDKEDGVSIPAIEDKEKSKSIGAKAKKKISATAHANFRALKIKNKMSKGKGRGRFGKR